MTNYIATDKNMVIKNWLIFGLVRLTGNSLGRQSFHLFYAIADGGNCRHDLIRHLLKKFPVLMAAAEIFKAHRGAVVEADFRPAQVIFLYAYVRARAADI